MRYEIAVDVTRQKTGYWTCIATVKTGTDINAIYGRDYREGSFSRGEAAADLIDFLIERLFHYWENE